MDADAELRGSSAPAVALTLDERMQRTRVFLDAGDAKTALAELDRSEANGLVRDPAARAQVALLRAQALFALNQVERGRRRRWRWRRRGHRRPRPRRCWSAPGAC